MTAGVFKQWFFSELIDYYEERELRTIFFMVLEHSLGVGRTAFLSDPSRIFGRNELARVRRIVRRLQQWEPIQYILGKSWFYQHEFLVNRHVLIPRPETEELVDLVIRQHADTKHPLQILDIGTGSGCIACTLALHLPVQKVWASDISLDALQVARKNALRLGTGIEFLHWDVLSDRIAGEVGKPDLIISNPPYVRESERLHMKPHVTGAEPCLALFVSDTDPLVFYRRICALAASMLGSGGYLYLEINEAFGHEVSLLCQSAGLHDISVLNDIHGKDRFVRGMSS